MTKIYPLIICGGNGTRLWPVSRTQSPKQFQRVGGPDSPTFFQMAVLRHSGEGFEIPWIISSMRHRGTIIEQLGEISATSRLMMEPQGRNTGPAVLAASIALHAVDPEAIILVVPADHMIEGDLNSPIFNAAAAAAAGHIVTFGIKPRFPETGFGYITDDGPLEGFPGLCKVKGFVEKPPLRKAKQLIDSGKAHWSSGISMFSATTIISEYERFDPASTIAVRMAVMRGRQTVEGLELNAEFFAAATAGPTEGIIFEKTERIAMAPLDIQWSDVGSWTAMYGISKSNPKGNVLQGDVVAVDTTNSMVRASNRLVTLVGMKDVIVIDTPDALLVTRVGHCQSVKKVAEYLKSSQRVEAEAHRDDSKAGVPTNYGDMVPLFQSDSMEMVSATIATGQSLMLDAVNDRELMVSRGSVTVITMKSSATLQPGQRMNLINSLPTMLVNPGPGEVEIILVTMLGAPVKSEEGEAGKDAQIKQFVA